MEVGGPEGVQSQPQGQLHSRLESSLAYRRLSQTKTKSANLSVISLMRALLTALLTFNSQQDWALASLCPLLPTPQSLSV